jgi:hypothetical protein
LRGWYLCEVLLGDDGCDAEFGRDLGAMVTLGAILLNPSLGSGAQTVRQLEVVGRVLRCDGLQIANLFSVATRDITEINEAGKSGDGWVAARPQLGRVIAECDCLLAGWGVGGLAGRAANYQRLQLGYVRERAREAGHYSVWTLNGEPRHPSRWHQYVSDRHGRAHGSCFEERIKMVLRDVAFDMVCGRVDARELIPC